MQELDFPFWKKAPFFKALLPFIIGIVVARYGPSSAYCILLAFVLPAALLIWLQQQPLSIRFQWQTRQGILLHLLFMAWGMGVMFLQDTRRQPSWYGNVKSPSAWHLKLLQLPEVKSKSVQAIATVTAVWQHGRTIKTTGKIILLLKKDSNSLKLADGDELWISKQPTSIQHSCNPGAFNYKEYRQAQQIYEQVYVDGAHWELSHRRSGSSFFHQIFLWQIQIRHQLKKYLGADAKVLGIAEALLIGYKADLDPELVQSYSNTGVVHIIAISGLHLGLIYWVLNYLLGLFPFLQKQKWLKAIMILSALWTFSLLTGASASVLRSAVMFTIIVVGEAGSRKAPIFNSLAASALLLLLYQPYLLWDVGFQLSYLAIIGIVMMQKPIENWLYIPFKPLHYIWQMCSVTLAAQIMTTPVALLYFHQFPNYFLAANLPAVPLSTIILFAELLLLMVAPFPLIAQPIAAGCTWLIRLLNAVIESIHHWPYAIVDYIPANLLTTFLLYGLLLLLFNAVQKKSKANWVAVASFFTLFNVAHLIWAYRTTHQQKWAVLQIHRASAVIMAHGGSYSFWGDSIILKDPSQFKKHIRPVLLEWRLQPEALLTAHHQKGMLLWQHNSFNCLWIHATASNRSIQSPCKLDFVILSHSPPLAINQIQGLHKKTTVIFDASNPLWKIAKWKKECDVLHLRCISIPESGAFQNYYSPKK